MKWPTVGLNVDEKQGLKKDKYEECLELGRQVGEMMKNFVDEPPHCV
jgi:hypothetical protein